MCNLAQLSTMLESCSVCFHSTSRSKERKGQQINFTHDNSFCKDKKSCPWYIGSNAHFALWVGALQA